MTKIDASLEEKKRRMEELVKLLNEAGALTTRRRGK